MARDATSELEGGSSLDTGYRSTSAWSRARQFLFDEIDPNACLFQYAGYCLLTGLTSAPVFSACFIWPGFQSGNAVQLAIAIARLFAARPKDTQFERPDQQALCSLITFLLGASLGRIADRLAWTQKRIWVGSATLFQGMLTMAAALCIHFSDEPSLASGRGAPAWTSVLGFATIGFVSASLGLQGIVAKRIKSEFGTSVVLTTVWVELVCDPSLLKLRPVRTRDHRVIAIAGLVIGGLFGAALTHTIGAAGAFGVTAGVRIVSAISWVLVPAKKR